MTGRPAPDAAVRVRARGFGWRYATRAAWALRGVDLDLGAGERVLLLGRSGSGKSTLLAGLAGLLDPGPLGRPDGGTGELEGTLDLLLGDGAVVPARPGGPGPTAGPTAGSTGAGSTGPSRGLLLQDPLAQTVLARCGDDVAFGLENHGVPRTEIWPRVDEALAAVRFPYGRGHSTARLSGGERQRLALAGVIALRPGLILLDEPTAMLDPAGAAALRAAVDDELTRTGATCILVEHRVGPWLPMIDRVVVLDPGGGVVADGPPDDVLRARGAELAAGGVWVPGHEPRARRRPGRPPAGPDGAPVVLRTRGLAVARTPGRPVVRDLDLRLRAGHALCLTGPNGSGKSTLALALGGLATPEAGVVEARDARDQLSAPHTWRARDLITRIGTVFQEPQHQFVAATVADELAIGPRRAGLPGPEVTARTTELLERLRLTHLARANPFTLSGGEQRRLSVATVLATRPRLLVLDEPTFGQDSRTWAELAGLLLDLLDDGSALVLATHDEALVAALTADGRGDVLDLGRRGAAEAAA